MQRLQEGKLKAKKDNRPINDGDYSVACAQACPADAIVFGNVKDKTSLISKTRAENNNRLFHVLEQIHTLPNVNYLAKVRNSPTAGDIDHEAESATVTPSAHEPAAH